MDLIPLTNNVCRCTLYWGYDDEYRCYAWRVLCDGSPEMAEEITQFVMWIAGSHFEENELSDLLNKIREAFPDCEIDEKYDPTLVD